MKPNPTPSTLLRDLPASEQERVMDDLFELARGYGLQLSSAVKPALWAVSLGRFTPQDLALALRAHAESPKNQGWLNTPGDLVGALARVSPGAGLDGLDPDVHDRTVLAAMVAKVSAGGTSLVDLMNVRQYLAYMEMNHWTHDWRGGDAFRRRELEQRFLALCKVPRRGLEGEILTAEDLAAPAAPYLARVRRRRFREVVNADPVLLAPIADSDRDGDLPVPAESFRH